MSQQYQKQKVKLKEQGREEFRKEAKQILKDWYNDDKTCSGENCCIKECDLCMNCFQNLCKRFGWNMEASELNEQLEELGED